MKAKTVKSVLRKKIDEWIATIDDKALAETVKNDAIVTGGSITSMLMGEKVNDFDVYFKNRATCVDVAQYYVRKFKENPPTKFKDCPESKINIYVREEDDGRVKIVVQSAGLAGESGSDNYQYFETVKGDAESQEFIDSAVEQAQEVAGEDDKKDYRPIYLTSNAITLSGKLQLVIRFYGEPEVIHENYDFVHCTCSWDAATGNLVLPPEALECMLARELRYKSSKYPLCSIIRTRKFLSRDWKINAGQYVKMAWELNALDLSDPAVLEDQMVGVDSAYFEEVIRLLREKDADKVDGAYLMQLIDKVF